MGRTAAVDAPMYEGTPMYMYVRYITTLRQGTAHERTRRLGAHGITTTCPATGTLAPSASSKPTASLGAITRVPNIRPG